MEQRFGKNCYPRTVINLYIKLYCKRRRNASKNKMLEAIKSWVTLSPNEKLQFEKKYEICQKEHKKKLANYLSNTKPYLKEKDRRSVPELETKKECNIIINVDDEVANLEQRTINNTEQIRLHDSSHISVENMLSINDVDNLETSESTLNHALESQNSQYSDYSFENPKDVLAEPAPPTIRTAKELFDMINSNQGEANLVYASLTSKQKRRYQSAVNLLKDNYISKFKAYLESLPSKDLYNYYNNYFNV